MANGFEQKIDLERKFDRVFREITLLRYKIEQKQGFWIFKTHVYSKDSLFNSEHYSKINSITDKIGDDAKNWNNNGQLTKEGRACYEKEKEIVRRKMEDINEMIANREPTWWEQVGEFFQGFVILVRENMPDIAVGFLSGIFQYLGFPQLPGFVKRFLPLPPGNENDVIG